jgi:hypothetical protein
MLELQFFHHSKQKYSVLFEKCFEEKFVVNLYSKASSLLRGLNKTKQAVIID